MAQAKYPTRLESAERGPEPSIAGSDTTCCYGPLVEAGLHGCMNWKWKGIIYLAMVYNSHSQKFYKVQKLQDSEGDGALQVWTSP